MTYLLMLLVFISNLIDGLTTWYIIRRGIGSEVNKFYQMMIDVAGNNMALVSKILFGIILCAALWAYPAVGATAIVTTTNLYCSINNLYIIRRYGKRYH